MNCYNPPFMLKFSMLNAKSCMDVAGIVACIKVVLYNYIIECFMRHIITLLISTFNIIVNLHNFFPNRKLIAPHFTSIHYDEDGKEIRTDVCTAILNNNFYCGQTSVFL